MSSFDGSAFSPGLSADSPNQSDQIKVDHIIQINGRKVWGPPLDWQGPPPSNACELFIKKIPRQLSEFDLLPHLKRFGQIYEFRLMMDFNFVNRGFAFVRYANEDDAKRAMELLNHFFITPRLTLDVQRSFNKCRLFVGNIPKNLHADEIERCFSRIFPGLERVITLKRISDTDTNRGFVFLDFASHEAALEVKKNISPGSIKMWDRDLRITWANPERSVEAESLSKVKTLFVRNIHLSVTHKMLYDLLTTMVMRQDIIKISRVQEFAFINFATREVAERVVSMKEGHTLLGFQLHFEWALPPSADSVHHMKNQDFDAVLRLKCIANYWSIPIILFGSVFNLDRVQYAAIMIRVRSKLHALFFEVQINGLTDIQSRICEVAVHLINRFGGMPPNNYVLKIHGDEAHIVGVINDVQRKVFIPAHSIPSDLFIYEQELQSLCCMIACLGSMRHETIASYYQRALTRPGQILTEIPVCGNRALACVDPTYRRRPPLKYNINNNQIIMILCDVYTLTNFIFPNMNGVPRNLKGFSPAMYDGIRIPYTVLNLVPIHFAQPRNAPLKIGAVRYRKGEGYF